MSLPDLWIGIPKLGTKTAPFSLSVICYGGGHLTDVVIREITAVRCLLLAGSLWPPSATAPVDLDPLSHSCFASQITLHATLCGQNFPKPRGGWILLSRVTTSRCLILPLREDTQTGRSRNVTQSTPALDSESGKGGKEARGPGTFPGFKAHLKGPGA